jgi:hypothetical protein
MNMSMSGVDAQGDCCTANKCFAAYKLFFSDTRKNRIHFKCLGDWYSLRGPRAACGSGTYYILLQFIVRATCREQFFGSEEFYGFYFLALY